MNESIKVEGGGRIDKCDEDAIKVLNAYAVKEGFQEGEEGRNELREVTKRRIIAYQERRQTLMRIEVDRSKNKEENISR